MNEGDELSRIESANEMINGGRTDSEMRTEVDLSVLNCETNNLLVRERIKDKHLFESGAGVHYDNGSLMMKMKRPRVSTVEDHLPMSYVDVQTRKEVGQKPMRQQNLQFAEERRQPIKVYFGEHARDLSLRQSGHRMMLDPLQSMP